MGFGIFGKKSVIIRVDGGLCSQIAFAALGKFFEDKGYRVKYDLTWYRQNGMDMDNRFVRNFDMAKAFPEMVFNEASDTEIGFYKMFHKRNSKKNVTEQKPPVYLDSYDNERHFLFVHYRDYFIKAFRFNTKDKTQLELLSEIENTNSVGVHIRRGDIATSNCYGKPADIEYFVKAMNMIQNGSKDKSVKFYLFSDEPEWISENILPEVKGLDCKLCTGNGSDKGYLDLYLLSRCKHIISSNGSMGAYARILSPNEPELYTCKYFDFIFENFENVTLLNYPGTIMNKTRIFSEKAKVPFKDKIFSIKQDNTYLTVTIMFIKFKFNMRK